MSLIYETEDGQWCRLWPIWSVRQQHERGVYQRNKLACMLGALQLLVE